MVLAVALILVTVASVLFHFLSPWWFTPLASNWKLIDDTILITLVITGGVFVAVNLFIAWALIRYRHRPGRRATYEPENKKLEGWLTIGTSLGIIAMLAPGLYVYTQMIRVPEDAIVVEAVGQQWQWRFRLPGEDGRLGRTGAAFVSLDNPLGLDPDDPDGHDDLIVPGPDLVLPLDRPVLVLLRAHDVLHNFYVPQFRVKMDLVPGLVSRFWFTPTATGRFEILCAELCGVGHWNMRGHVEVVDKSAYREWRAALPTFGAVLAAAADDGLDEAARRGRELARERGCLACHTLDGAAGIGPTWQGLYGAERPLADGRSVRADADYLAEAIRDPNATLVAGFPAIMPRVDLSEAEVDALVAFIRSLGAPTAEAQGADPMPPGDAPAANEAAHGAPR